MQSFFALWASAAILIGSVVFSGVIQDTVMKWMARIIGVSVALVALVLMLPSGPSKPAGVYVPRVSEQREREKSDEPKELTLESVKQKGDRLTITCSERRGEVECKPREYRP